MTINDLKYVVGEAKAGDIATIRFSGKVTEDSTAQFNREFEFLENVICPRLIRVLINSEGGSVLYGMSTYSTIQNSTVETECVIEGMAASMASIIWAAGTKSLMRDYSILMIHNPFLPSADNSEPSDLVKAFTYQVEMIYRKRFGLKKEQVQAIMAGEAGKDGTYFNAQSAVKAGIIPADNVIHTSKQLCDKVKNELDLTKDITEIQDLMSRICSEAAPLEVENKHFQASCPNLNQNIENIKNTLMNEEKTPGIEFGAVAATLGMKDSDVKDVMARISTLMGVEAKLDTTSKALNDAQLIIAGKEATVQNLQKDLSEVKAKLNVYETKEADEKKLKIKTLVEAAINEGKIDKGAEAQWTQMAASNYDLAESTLKSIPAREIISQEIASDPENIQATVQGTRTAETIMAEKVKAVVGENFEFKKMS
ncbi:ATP-dependent Clp protease proteolytic subunit [uncultured Bacteroides sp.]|uniref:Clp protease ClpP n=1 Tax=uncultured Bacteroides sp. TaxID=162156 RepID=UPI0025F0583A|nr:Clp protease ClpP [uncultured Bacteroides sp.]